MAGPAGVWGLGALSEEAASLRVDEVARAWFYVRPCLAARTAACVRSVSSSRRRMLETWFVTVPVLRWSWLPIWRLVAPWARRMRTSRSRGERSSSGDEVDERSDPEAVLTAATGTADLLTRVIRERGLVARIHNREHVLLEGWTLLGSLVGVFPVTVWTRPMVDRGDRRVGWEARVEARTRSGDVVGAAEAECLTTESQWRNRDDHDVLGAMWAGSATAGERVAPLQSELEIVGGPRLGRPEVGLEILGADVARPVADMDAAKWWANEI